ncbi:sialic acid-binding Ig-like lectin 5 [Tenrec ecaudatus]|uniref:sialic acid-binding Ig-like lectin 5 n=1 Tax=Tenrec ecaudatus TaxID=94439 RepID=UPI003F595FD4
MLPWLLLPLLWGGSLQEDFELQVPERVTVQEGLCVTVPCKFITPWKYYYDPTPLYIFWFESGDNVYHDSPVATNHPTRAVKTGTKGRFQLIGYPRTNDCSLSIRDARRSDARDYILRVERGTNMKYTYRDSWLTLLVTDLTEKPTIHILKPLESGRPANLTCSVPGSCEGGRSLAYAWVGEALNKTDPTSLQSPVLTFNPRPQDHGTNLTCRVKLERRSSVSTEETILLNVSYAPAAHTIRVFQGGSDLQAMGNFSTHSVLEGQSLHLQCVALSNPPAELSWFQGPSVRNVSISNSSDLRWPRVRLEDAGSLTCRAKNALGSGSVSVDLFVLYAPRLTGPSCFWEAEVLHCTCSAQAWPVPSLHWWIGDGRVEGNSSNASITVTITSSSTKSCTNSSLRLQVVLTSVLRLYCEARNDLGNQRVTILLLPGKSASRTAVALGALGGAGTMALICLCVCLTFFFLMKTHRKQANRKPEGADDEDPVMGTVTWSCRQKPWPDNPQGQVPHSGNTPPLTEEQELHYASLSFDEMTLQEPKDPGTSSTTEYSEIKTSN